MFRVSFRTGNDAFVTDPHEAARILKEVADQLRLGRTAGRCIDANGNVIGKWELTARQG